MAFTILNGVDFARFGTSADAGPSCIVQTNCLMPIHSCINIVFIKTFFTGTITVWSNLVSPY